METGVSYYGSRILRHIQADLEDIAAHDCTYVVHTFSEADLLHYRGTMREIVKATHAAGLKAWLDPWAVGGVFGGEALSLYAARFPEHQQVLSNGARVPLACPNRYEFRTMLRQWVDAAVETGADVLFWDEPHFCILRWLKWYDGTSDAWACRCTACQYLYRERYGEDLPIAFDDSVRAFRQERLLDFLADMTGYAASQGATNALCLLPAAEDHQDGLPFRAAAGLPNIQIFGTDPYWLFTNLTVEEHVGQQTARVVEICRYLNKPAQIWVQAFGIPDEREEEVATAIEIAASGGAEYIAAWHYPASGYISPAASARPEVVWETIGDAYRKVRQQRARTRET
jgi:hypothetical protein